MLRLEQIERHGVGIVRLQKPGLFVGQPLLLCCQTVVFGPQLHALGPEFIDEGLLDRVAKFWIKLELLVVLFDALFDQRDQQGALSAVGSLLVSSYANEVGVYLTVPVLGVSDG
ncbi:hypothetical protein [Mycobacterium sp. Aquia_213]|uniref:hypothetical protein n=1 Tax=Mycobacterium sp. Aquia_213 TaxID=2991728 RepID=UPI002270C40D|nr:hypothetical protein [Mycobacterium sp. Aquia_213]WAC90230.1 hypothetical protein LMQ14_20190 [Mycobacterium sp. Aquia_213]